MNVEAIYEKGTLKLSQQINIEDGTKVSVIILPIESYYWETSDFSDRQRTPHSAIR